MTLLAKSAGSDGSPETLLAHTLAVVAMARDLCNRLPLAIEARRDLLHKAELAAALHDIGKIAPGFQRVLQGKQRDWHGWRHEALSAGFASAVGHPVPDEVVFAVLFHHKEIPGDSSRAMSFFDGQPDAWPRLVREWRECAAVARTFWSDICLAINRLEFIDVAEVTEIRLQQGWLDSSPTTGQCQQIEPERRFEASRLRGLLICADHLASARRQLPAMVEVREFRMKYEPRPFQVRAGVTSGNAILRAPTGSGKTEAGLLWAGANQIENGRLLYVLPFTAAINAMHSRLCDSFPDSRQSVGVLHGRASHHLYSQMLRDYPGDRHRAQKEAKARARLAREMYHPVRVCTPHQLLRHTLHGLGWEHMLLEFPGACVIFDEIHSYQPDLAGLTLGTACLLTKRFGARVLFASATFPRFLERLVQELIPSAVIEPDWAAPRDREIIERKRHTVRLVDGNLMGVLDEIIRDVLSGRSVLVVCNHVQTAQVVYKTLLPKLGQDSIVLFHSRFNMEDRRRIEQSLMPESLPRILVATQVVEVSLDIDFNCGYFEAAPIDALIQRMGRVNRKAERAPEPITILRDPVGSYPIYEGTLTSKTLSELQNLPNPIGEHDLAAACDRVYRDGYNDDEQRLFEERLNHPFFSEFERHLTAGRSEQWVDRVLSTAEGSADLLPRSLLSRYRNLSKEGLWLEADALLVSVRTNSYRGRIVWEHDPPLVKAEYSSDEGLQ